MSPPSRVRAHREARGLTQDDLARAARLSRQSVGSIEAGRSVPAVDVALRVCAALGASVEELFGTTGGAETIEAEGSLPVGARAVLAELRGRWVAHALSPESVVSDALVVSSGRGGAQLEPTRPLAEARDTLLVAGCATALGLVCERASRGAGRVMWLPCSSAVALDQLARGRVHVAAIHRAPSRAPSTVRAPRRVVRFASWEAGLVVPAGNPRGVRGVADLGRRGVTVVTREPGAGARRVLDRLLEEAGLTLAHAIEARGHREVATLVGLGAAEAGIATRAVAIARGLGFVPLVHEHVDLVLEAPLENDPRVLRLLEALAARGTRRELESLGYDTRQSGAHVGEAA
ncbi:MAG: helix-turn-helix domain-containing protein [Sandaracinaceae bacterium]|nr:helix-turn-helix domain-containing protein [Sandaracinaceae bacterium]